MVYKSRLGRTLHLIRFSHLNQQLKEIVMLFFLQFNDLLHDLISIDEAYESGTLSDNDRFRRKVKVFEELNQFLDNTDSRMNSRLNTARSTDAFRVQRIVRLLEGKLKNFDTFCYKNIYVFYFFNILQRYWKIVYFFQIKTYGRILTETFVGVELERNFSSWLQVYPWFYPNLSGKTQTLVYLKSRFN